MGFLTNWGRAISPKDHLRKKYKDDIGLVEVFISNVDMFQPRMWKIVETNDIEGVFESFKDKGPPFLRRFLLGF